MKRLCSIGIVSLLLFSCAPVLNRELMREGQRNTSFEALRSNPAASKGKLSILGGVIIETRMTDQGSQIEALAVPVNSRGYLEGNGQSPGSFLAVYPRSMGLLDPAVYKKGREITLAGRFREVRKGGIDETAYTYPVFEIKELYLWKEHNYHYWPWLFFYPFYDPAIYFRWGPFPYPYLPRPMR